jgi:hypothetical protein
MTQNEVKVALDVVVGMLRWNSSFLYVLIDSTVTHSFIAQKIMGEHGEKPSKT